MALSRRHFVQRGVALSMGFAGLRGLLSASPSMAAVLRAADGAGYGPLVADPLGVLDLPVGFKYRVISAAGETMDDGLIVPEKHDGMATFPAPDGLTYIVRNHEIDSDIGKRGPFGPNNERLSTVDRARIFDPGMGDTPALGGCTTLIFDTRTQALKGHHLSLAGTMQNCAGGATPWGTWLSCEETMALPDRRYSKAHGYVFEVRPSMTPGLVDPKPIVAMGRFQHEAVAIDPVSGCVFLTEDLADGLVYRFIPTVPGDMHAGGRLQALMIRGRRTVDTRNWEAQTVAVGKPLEVEWIDVEDIESPNNDLRLQGAERGAAVFGRGEGMWKAADGIYFACTSGGKAQMGQIWRYIPSPHEGTPGESSKPATLELFIEPNDGSVVANADNITASPWGDLLVCEDAAHDDDNDNFLLGVTPDRRVYKLAKNAVSSSEFAGATFSPDGSTLFVNVQGEGKTFAITGPWKKG